MFLEPLQIEPVFIHINHFGLNSVVSCNITTFEFGSANPMIFFNSSTDFCSRLLITFFCNTQLCDGWHNTFKTIIKNGLTSQIPCCLVLDSCWPLQMLLIKNFVFFYAWQLSETQLYNCWSCHSVQTCCTLQLPTYPPLHCFAVVVTSSSFLWDVQSFMHTLLDRSRYDHINFAQLYRLWWW